MFKDKVDKFVAQHYDEVTHETAPALVAKVKELAEKAGVAAPKVYMPKSNVGGMVGHAVGVTPGADKMIVGHKMLEMMNASRHHISDEFEGIIAHELAHIKNGDMKLLGSKNIALSAPVLGVVASVGALALVEHHLAKKKKTKETLLPGEEGYTPAVAEEDRKHPLGAAITAAKYIAAAAVGLAAGIYGFKMLSHRMEYRADAFSAELLKDKKPLIRAFEIMKEKSEEQLESIAKIMRRHGHSAESIESQHKARKWVSELTHPPIQKRIDRLNGI